MSAMLSSTWSGLLETANPERQAQWVEEAVRALQVLPPAVQHNPELLQTQARATLRRLTQIEPLTRAELETLTQTVLARVAGLGFFHALLPPQRTDLAEIAVNPDGCVWLLYKGQAQFTLHEYAPSSDEVWRAVEAMLARAGRTLTEVTPSMDARLPRFAGFGGARLKVVHPVIAGGRVYPAVNLRLFEAEPVLPHQLIEWEAAPAPVMETLLEAVRSRARILIVGGTATGKTTWLSALACAIPASARLVKIEDPEEIHLANPNVVTLEARPALPGSSVPPYTIRHAVDDAMRMAPQWLIVGEVRTGDAALALFRAQMSDHPGLSTFHADSPEQAVTRMALIMFADAGVEPSAAQAIFAQAVDVVVQVGWRTGRRQLLGVWRVGDYTHGRVAFEPLWERAA